MKQIKNKIKERVRYWLDECDTYTVSLVISGFFYVDDYCWIITDTVSCLHAGMQEQ